MLASLDTYAFKLLVVLYSFLGIQDIPKEPNPDWTVVERWTPQSDGSYRLYLVSQSIDKQCSSGKFIIFPQVYMGKFEIFVDHQLVYTNSMSTSWHLKEMLSRPVINCAAVNIKSLIEFKVDSHLNFFTSLSFYPYIVSAYPLDQFFYEHMYLIAGVSAVILGLVGAALMILLVNFISAVTIFFKQLSFAGLVLFHVPGVFSDISIFDSHAITVCFLCLAGYSLLITTLKYKYAVEGMFILIATNLGLFFVIRGHPNLVHVFIILSATASVIVFTCIVWYLFHTARSRSGYFMFILYAILLIGCYFDLINSQRQKNSMVYLSFIVIVASIITFVKSLQEIIKKQIVLSTVNMKLKNERKIMEKMSEVYIKYQEIVHDIKGPLTTISFLMSKNKSEINKLILDSNNRIKEIINRLQNDHENLEGWYSAESIKQLLEKIIDEKTSTFPDYKFDMKEVCIPTDIECYINPIDMQIIFEELCENAIKYTDLKSKKIEIVIDIRNICLNIQFKNRIDEDRCVSEAEQIKSLQNIGSGNGLYLIRQKLKKNQGSLKIRLDGEIFIVDLELRGRLLAPS